MSKSLIQMCALMWFNGEDQDRYILGDDALACLRDIKRWLKLYDEKNNRMDVARCLGEANLVNGDLLPILSLWWANGQKNKHMTRIALACLELLVPLTWPIEYHSQMTVNHHRHTAYLQQIQVQYKRGVLKYGGPNLLRTIIRIAIPSMAMPRSEREARDEGILKLMLYFLRNIAIISTNARLAADGEEEETSRSATIDAFQQQDAFALILTMCSNVGEDFNLQDVILLEILFHLVKGVNVEKLFMDDPREKSNGGNELKEMLRKEALAQKEYSKNGPHATRAFWDNDLDNDKVSTVSGQSILKDNQRTLQKMDETKKWNKPKPRKRQEDVVQNNNFNMPTPLSFSASKNLRDFVEEFLDAGFNPLFTHVRKAIEREAERILEINTRQFFYTVGWFLEAERARRSRQVAKMAQTEKGRKLPEPDSFGLVAAVLNQEMFISLNRAMQNSLDSKEWEDVTAQMRCFTQILLTVQEMAASPIEEDQEIAENIQNRIFYEETTHDRIISIVRGYKDQGFGYLDAATELAHVFLRMLERYSKENVDLQVRSRRKARRNKKKTEDATGQDGGDNDEGQKSEEEDIVDAAKVSKERSFDFKRFAAKFCNQSCVDTFVAFTHSYRELSAEQLKRAHRYFYRVAFKNEMSVLLFRVDIINLFYRMIKGPGAMDPDNRSVFREWEELVRQLIRRLVKKIDQRPGLVTEMLFSKMNSTAFYLEYGHDKQTISRAKQAPTKLVINHEDAKTPQAKFGIVAGALTLDGQLDLMKWMLDTLSSAASERESWEAEEEARRAENPEATSTPNPMIHVKARDEFCQKAMFSNAKLRLLMELAGFERLGVADVPGAAWVIPPSLKAHDLQESVEIINRIMVNPRLEGTEEDPRKLLQSKKAARDMRDSYQVHFGSDSEGEDIAPDEVLFPPNPRTKSSALDELKKKRKKKSKSNSEREPLDDETIEARRQSRLTNDLARQAKIKSDLFIHASDEESDEDGDQEFFRLEEERRKKQAAKVKKAMLLGIAEQKGKKASVRKRKSDTGTSEPKRRRHESGSAGSDGDGDDDEDISMADVDAASPGSQQDVSASHGFHDEDTPLTSAEDELMFDDDLAFSRNHQSKPSMLESDEAEEEDAPVVPSRRVRGGFVIDSDSE
ncbi:hypothetical protein N7468_006410 [Penicillium chermesinum]|uniref:Topoisomerase 1-associated factor 1 n=1 Tax=Penicillium chermesinum TaxID=63820 RepID=A0A9W9TL38_9EURO|nr:uncharacterized protein N7468_006410 [Penicillium chermesinum]KAJ5225185.1 hypothetical protein N7468_006410 [Penicillium chermesinum]